MSQTKESNKELKKIEPLSRQAANTDSQKTQRPRRNLKHSGIQCEESERNPYENLNTVKQSKFHNETVPKKMATTRLQSFSDSMKPSNNNPNFPLSNKRVGINFQKKINSGDALNFDPEKYSAFKEEPFFDLAKTNWRAKPFNSDKDHPEASFRPNCDDALKNWRTEFLGESKRTPKHSFGKQTHFGVNNFHVTSPNLLAGGHEEMGSTPTEVFSGPMFRHRQGLTSHNRFSKCGMDLSGGFKELQNWVPSPDKMNRAANFKPLDQAKPSNTFEQFSPVDKTVDKGLGFGPDQRSSKQEKSGMYYSESDPDFQFDMSPPAESGGLIQGFGIGGTEKYKGEKQERIGEAGPRNQGGLYRLGNLAKRDRFLASSPALDVCAPKINHFKKYLAELTYLISCFEKKNRTKYLLAHERNYLLMQMRQIWGLIENNETKNLYGNHRNTARQPEMENDQSVVLNVNLGIDSILEKFSLKKSRSPGLQMVKEYDRSFSDKLYPNSPVESPKPLNRVAYVPGDPEEYVFVKLNREKTRKPVKMTADSVKLFGELWGVLRTLLWSGRVGQEELDSLNKRDRQILSAFLVKKKLVEDTNSLSFEETEFNRVIAKAGPKRTEQNLKCVFNHIYKFLRGQFKKKHENFLFRKQDAHLSQKNLIDLGFYTYYFGRIADAKGWPISKFFHPKVPANKQCNEESFLEEPEQLPKSINKEYIRNLRLSKPFIRDVSAFLNNHFEPEFGSPTGIVDEFKKACMSKMILKLNLWSNIIKKNGQSAGLQKILNELRKNDKSKLPWSLNEMNKAINETLDSFSISKRILR